MKRWILPALFAVALHAMIFSLDLFSTRPVLAMRENRTVTISLAAVAPPQPATNPIAAHVPAAVSPLAPLPVKPILKHKVPEPELPQPKPDEKTPEAPFIDDPQPDEAAAKEPAAGARAEPGQTEDSATKTPEAMTEPQGPDQARATASVPLYHLNPAPAYPAVARRRNYQGTVLLDVFVDREGRAEKVQLARSSGHEVLDRSALRSVRQWRFEPGRRMGRPVAMWVKVPVRFILN